MICRRSARDASSPGSRRRSRHTFNGDSACRGRSRQRARIDERELIAKVRTHIDRYKVPKSIIVVEELPKTSTGKIQKNAVRDKFAGHYSTG
jgi:acyl-CoA synthetase (AMP-forming)/AMP-acid ligase II